MIIQLEVQNMINELNKHNSVKARDYVSVLNRVLIELREQNEIQNNIHSRLCDAELTVSKWMLEHHQKDQQLALLQQENNQLKQNIK